MNEEVENGKKMIFYPVTIDEINAAEKQMNKKFPASIRQFYQEIGWVFF